MSAEERKAVNALAAELPRLLVRDYGGDLRGDPSMEYMRAWAIELLDALDAAGLTITEREQEDNR